MSRKKKTLCVTAAVLVLLVAAYFVAAYSHIGFIEKWRTLWIETAMTTNSHQWLAKLFPQSVIDEVMADMEAQKEAQKSLASTWDSLVPIDVVYGKQTEPADSEQEEFFARYWELDTEEFRAHLERNPQLLADGYGHIMIEDMEGALGLKTKQGHPLLVLDAANGLVIVLENLQMDMSYYGKKKICDIHKAILYSVNHPLADKEDLCAKDFEKETFFVVNEDMDYVLKRNQDLYTQFHFGTGIRTAENIHTLYMNVANGLGVTIQDEWGPVENKSLYRTLVLEDTVEIFLVWKNPHSKEDVDVFERFFTDHFHYP